MPTENNKPITPQDTIATYTQFIFPSDLNALNTLYGGSILSWMDITAAITAQRHSKIKFTTAALYDVNFIRPVSVGQIITLQGKITRVFNTSLEVAITIYPSDYQDHYQDHQLIATAHFCMVGLYPQGTKQPLPPVVPVTPEEKQQYEQADIRRQLHQLKKQTPKIDLQHIINTNK